MNLVNRIFMILVCLSLIAVAVSLIVLAWTIPNDTIEWLRNAVEWMDENDGDFQRGVLSAVAAGAALLALIVLLFELLPKGAGDVKVTDLQVGDAVLSTAAIGQRVEEAVRLVPHVADVKATVKTKRKGVAVGLDLHVDPDANLAEVTDAACQAASDVLTQRVHVSLAAPPRARLHYRELRLNRPQRPVLVPPPTPVAEPEPPVGIGAEAAPEPVTAGVGAAESASGEATEEKPV